MIHCAFNKGHRNRCAVFFKYSFFKRAGINTVEELTSRTSEDMMKVRNLGRKSLEEVLGKLKELGLSLNLGDE